MATVYGDDHPTEEARRRRQGHRLAHDACAYLGRPAQATRAAVVQRQGLICRVLKQRGCAKIIKKYEKYEKYHNPNIKNMKNMKNIIIYIIYLIGSDYHQSGSSPFIPNIREQKNQ